MRVKVEAMPPYIRARQREQDERGEQRQPARGALPDSWSYPEKGHQPGVPDVVCFYESGDAGMQAVVQV